MRHILSLLVENEAGALSRISGLFSARAFNIESLTVAPTDEDTVSRMTIVTHGSDEIVEQITKQVNKLLDVIKVVDLNERKHIERELLLIKISAVEDYRDRIETLVADYDGQILDNSDNIYTIQLTDTGERLDEFIKSIDRPLILEVVRSGVTGIALGSPPIFGQKL